jgi:hypothetical protein
VEDFLFVLRTFGVTVVLFLLMQIRVGNTTLEQHSLSWMHSSRVAGTLQEVADGAVHIFHLASVKIQKVGQEAFGAKDSSGSEHLAKRRALRRTLPVTPPDMTSGSQPVARAEGETKSASELKRGTFRSFFDVKSVNDESAQ